MVILGVILESVPLLRAGFSFLALAFAGVFYIWTLLMPIDAAISGFSSWANFLKATVALGITLGTTVWATITWGLDTRYALAEDLKQVQQDVSTLTGSVQTIAKRQLQDAILNTKARACRANGEARVYFESELQSLMEEYAATFGNRPYVPDCEDLQ